ncbi:MAG TPA: hypothetical protein VFU22_20880 [Roseiflexaceae bacterium]|nr:hypothetical protein [Roseiflexaceae bacterium]
MQQDAAQAKQLLIRLKARNKQQGLFADPSLEISVEDYGRALSLVSAATSDPEQARQVARLARVGQATVGPYPDREDWIGLIKVDPVFARELYDALREKQAMFGLQTPQAILLSMRAYAAVSKPST